MSAGQTGFKEFYLNSLEETRLHGKRPDLLIYNKAGSPPADISAMPFEESDRFVSGALAAIEVRSSKFEAEKYMKYRAQQKAEGVKGVRECPSFTVKVEDLKIVHRWIQRNAKPQTYAQVFFDSVWMINFLKIFQTIAYGTRSDFTIESPAKSQEKATIMIPITMGTRVGIFESLPHFTTVERVTALGRHDAFVKPEGGRATLDLVALRTCLMV